MIVTSDQLITTTAWLLGIERTAILSRNRSRHVVEARQALAWSLRESGWSLESIGAFLDRDHTTIIHALKAVERKARRSPRLAERLKVLSPAVEPAIDWQARAMALEARVAQLEALVGGQS